MIEKRTTGEKIFQVFNYTFLILLTIVTLYPCYYIVVASVSDPVKISASNGMLLWPKGFATYSYGEVFKSSQLWTGYLNTIIYVVLGGLLSVGLTVSAAYALTRKGLPGKNWITMLILFTMYFSGGLIPTYIVVKMLKITDTLFAMILPNAIVTTNLIITMTYFRGMPDSIDEAARIDGANDYQILFDIMLPLAKPIVAVIALYYVVGIWNNYFSALIYIDSRSKYPLQLVLREILIQNNTSSIAVSATPDDAAAYAENVKYATIVLSTIPILCVYPFLQKYFVKGIMIGSVKG